MRLRTQAQRGTRFLMSPLACINKEAPSGLMMMAVKSELVINPYNSFTLLFLDQVRFSRKSKKTKIILFILICFLTGTVWTASAHIITAVIGSGVLSLAWAIAQLGWIAGPAFMFLFSIVTCYTSSLLSVCYRSGDPITGKRNYTYMDAVRSNLGKYSCCYMELA